MDVLGYLRYFTMMNMSSHVFNWDRFPCWTKGLQHVTANNSALTVGKRR